MLTNTQIVNQFYQAFSNRDGNTMASLYANNVVFEDPAFGELKGEDAKAMWRMLCANGKDLKVWFEIRDTYEDIVEVQWEANYTFSQTGNRVHNKISARIRIKDQQIIEHIDQFNLWTWSQQALGATGWLFGWSSYFQKKLHKQTGRMLQKFMSNN